MLEVMAKQKVTVSPADLGQLCGNQCGPAVFKVREINSDGTNGIVEVAYCYSHYSKMVLNNDGVEVVAVGQP